MLLLMVVGAMAIGGIFVLFAWLLVLIADAQAELRQAQADLGGLMSACDRLRDDLTRLSGRRAVNDNGKAA